MTNPILITGCGVVSAIGNNKAETLDALLNNRSGVGPLVYLRTEHKEFPVGEVKMSDDEMRKRLNISDNNITTRTALMGMIALDEALKEAKITPEMIPNIGFISGTTVGGMDMSEQFYLDYVNNENHKEYIAVHDCGSCSEMTAEHFGKFAFITTLSTACSSAANAIILGANMIRCGEADIVVVGGSECITKFHLNGFNSLMILDTQWCRPFDATRAGLNLGEGAAYLVLESEESAKKRGVKAQAILSGYGNACDAFHQTASSPDGEGAFKAMKEALQLADIQPDKIDYINAHGTGTPNNDASESTAVKRLFGENVPPMSSTKQFTGHTTSASGSIEAVFCILALQNGFVPVNLNWSQPMEDGIVPVHQSVKKELKHVLCNAFGFGGNDSSLLLSKYETSSISSETTTPIYVLSAKQISVQQPLCEDWMTQPIVYQQPFNRSIDPSFKDYISPIEARRMGKILKRAIATSKEAIKASGLESVDAIITGTGYGCIENTEFFLDALSKDGEQMLSPTYFMQSTHNTISSLVAIQTKNHGYNVTYAHKGISFDSALQDAVLQMRLGKINSALIGGHDELTETFYRILKKGGMMGQDDEMCGEAAVSVVLGTKNDDYFCKLVNFKMLHKPTLEKLKAVAKDFQADYIITGISGNHKSDEAYFAETKELFSNAKLLKYKHIFGESFTSSGIGIYVAVQCLKAGKIPAHLFVNPSEISDKKPSKILIFNHSDGNNYSLTLLEA